MSLMQKKRILKLKIRQPDAPPDLCGWGLEMESHVLGVFLRYRRKNPWRFFSKDVRSNVRWNKGQNAISSAEKKTETLSRVNRCIFLGVFVQSAIGTARRQMKQCIQSTCGIKHLKRPTVRVFPLWEIIAYHDSTYTVRKIKKAAQVLQAFVDLTWFNSESQRDLLDPYSFAPLFSKMAFQVSVFKLVSKWKYSKLGCL